MHTREKGALGEQLVQRYLESKGFAIVTRNYYYEHCEIDLIAHKDELLYFIEVKSTFNKSGQPYENCHVEKINRTRKAALGFMQKNRTILVPPYDNYLLSLALVYINETTKKAKVQFIENVLE